MTFFIQEPPEDDIKVLATKTEAGERLLPLPDDVLGDLRQQFASHEHDWVFPTRDGTPHRQDNIGKWWNAILVAANVPHATLYSLRHTFCSEALGEGEAAHNVGRTMGHEKSELAERDYAHTVPEAVRKVIDAVSRRLAPPTSPNSSPPRLRVIKGGKGIRKVLDESVQSKEVRA